MTFKSGRGGKRPGAGRPKNSGWGGEETVAVRIPLSKALAVADYLLYEHGLDPSWRQLYERR